MTKFILLRDIPGNPENPQICSWNGLLLIPVAYWKYFTPFATVLVHFWQFSCLLVAHKLTFHASHSPLPFLLVLSLILFSPPLVAFCTLLPPFLTFDFVDIVKLPNKFVPGGEFSLITFDFSRRDNLKLQAAHFFFFFLFSSSSSCPFREFKIFPLKRCSERNEPKGWWTLWFSLHLCWWSSFLTHWQLSLSRCLLICSRRPPFASPLAALVVRIALFSRWRRTRKQYNCFGCRAGSE